MFQEKESFALYLLSKQGIQRLDVLRHTAHSEDRPITQGDDQIAIGDSAAEKKEVEKYASLKNLLLT